MSPSAYCLPPTAYRSFIIGHRGACGYLPEHTLESFERAAALGADAFEVDVVPTRDGHLVCRHDAELSITTDVADHPEFAQRRSEKAIDGVAMTGWFVEDFTLREICTLRARQRFDFRDRTFDGRFAVPTLDDAILFANSCQSARGEPLGLVIEIKHATYFASIGLPMDAMVARILARRGCTDARLPIWVESFETEILQQLRARSAVRLIQLLDDAALRPPDVAAKGGSLTYGQMITPDGLANIATYACAIGAWKRLIVPAQAGDADAPGASIRLAPPTRLIADAHAARLAVHAWTFRDEACFLADDYAGDPSREYQQFADLGLDGFITDFPDTARAVVR